MVVLHHEPTRGLPGVTRGWQALVLAAGLSVIFETGVVYAFGTFALDVAARLGVSTSDVPIMGASLNIGAFSSSIFAGVMLDRLGPRVSGTIGLLLQAGGWLVLLVLLIVHVTVPVEALCVLLFVTGTGNTFAIITAESVPVRWFTKEHAGIVLGVMGGGLYGLLNLAFAGADDAGVPMYFVVVLAMSTACNVFSVIIMRPPPPEAIAARGRAVRRRPRPLIVRKASASAVDGAPAAADAPESTPLPETPLTYAEAVHVAVKWPRRVQRELAERAASECGEEINALAMVKQLDFWLLFFPLMCSIGCILAVLNASGMVTRSAGVAIRVQFITALLAVGNAPGRLVMGLMSDACAPRMPRSLQFLLMCALTAVPCAMLAIDIGSIIFAIVIGGFAFGGLWSTALTSLTVRFGQQYLAQNQGVLKFGPGVGAIGLGALVSAVYSSMTPEGASQCMGTECFRLAYIVCTGVALAALVPVAVLVWRESRRRRALYAELVQIAMIERGGPSDEPAVRPPDELAPAAAAPPSGDHADADTAQLLHSDA